MNKASLHSLLLSVAVLIISTVGGALIAQKLAKGDAGISFLWFSCPIVSIIFFSQFLTFPNARKRLLFQLLYLGFFGFSMTWFMLSLSLPIFWIKEISAGRKVILALIFLAIMIINLNLGWRIFNKKWNEISGALSKSEADIVRTGDDWNKKIQNMKITHNIYVPGIPEKWTFAFSIALIAFMILGLNLITAYPTFSVFAWGISAAVMASYFIQVSGSYFAQAVQVLIIEKDFKYKIKSTS
jgi:hypothetical protein